MIRFLPITIFLFLGSPGAPAEEKSTDATPGDAPSSEAPIPDPDAKTESADSEEAAKPGASLRILAVVGTGGTEDYDEIFAEHAREWKTAAEKGGATFDAIGLESGGAPDRERLEEALASVEEPELWLVLIGHGTFDTREVKFNLHGPDVTDAELAEWLDGYPGRLSVINTASASGSFIDRLSGPDRVVITATKNETEVFYTRFGGYFVEAISGLSDADLDNDEQVSLLEAFLHAADRVATFYDNEGRLATEHALVDDNGDGLGSRSEWYEGTTPNRAPGKDLDPDGATAGQRVLVKNAFERRLTAEQRERRDQLERQVRELRRQRDELEEADYYERLEPLLIELGQLYRQVGDS